MSTTKSYVITPKGYSSVVVFHDAEDALQYIVKTLKGGTQVEHIKIIKEDTDSEQQDD